MTIKLRKTTAAQWLGNNMGVDRAVWTVVGHEDICIWGRSGGWKASCTDPDGGRKMIVNGANTKADLIEILEVKLGTPG